MPYSGCCSGLSSLYRTWGLVLWSDFGLFLFNARRAAGVALVLLSYGTHLPHDNVPLRPKKDACVPLTQPARGQTQKDSTWWTFDTESIPVSETHTQSTASPQKTPTRLLTANSTVPAVSKRASPFVWSQQPAGCPHWSPDFAGHTYKHAHTKKKQTHVHTHTHKLGRGLSVKELQASPCTS